MTDEYRTIQLTIKVPTRQHRLVREIAKQMVMEGKSKVPNAIPDTYAMLMSLALEALEATEDDAAAACTVAA